MTLRNILRDNLRDHHDKLDTALGGLDLTDPDGLASFLNSHWLVWSKIQASSDEARFEIECRIDALEKDLKILGHACLRPKDNVPVDDLAILYMAFGSQLGAAVLRKKWLKSSNRDVMVARHFFSINPRGKTWTELCADLSLIDRNSTRAIQVMEGVRKIYSLFIETLHHNQT